jgi:pimeloyl-ACP methyl ester carboxylesterase
VVTTDRQSARLHAELSGSAFDTIRDAGHMVHHVAPDMVLAAIFSAAGAPAGQATPRASQVRFR